MEVSIRGLSGEMLFFRDLGSFYCVVMVLSLNLNLNLNLNMMFHVSVF
jgi:hypothetical protein